MSHERTLDSWLREGPLADAETCAALVRALLLTLEQLHFDNEIQHSLDPRVIRLAPAQTGFEVVELGPRHHPEVHDCRDGIIHINLRYISPEYVRQRPLDHRHDLFIAGIFLYELVTGRYPFPGDNDMQRLTSLMAGPVTDVPSPHPELLAVALRMLRVDRDARNGWAEDWMCEIEDARYAAWQRTRGEREAAQALPVLEATAHDLLVPQVRSGLRTRDEIVERTVDRLLNTGMAALNPFERRPDLTEFVRALCERVVDRVIVELGAPPVEGDCARLDRAFEVLNSRGIVARQAIGWSWRDGLDLVLHDEVGEALRRGQVVRGYAFFHEFVVEEALAGYGLEIGFGSREGDASKSAAIGREIVEVLRSFELGATWSGQRADPIVIPEFVWWKLMPSK